jgi:hypothetical protein
MVIIVKMQNMILSIFGKFFIQMMLKLSNFAKNIYLIYLNKIQLNKSWNGFKNKVFFGSRLKYSQRLQLTPKL